MEVKTVNDLKGKVLFLNLSTKQWEAEVTNWEDILFEAFAKKEEVQQFNDLNKEVKGNVGTIVQDEEERGVNGERYDLFLIPGAHWTNRFGYFIYKLADGITEDPLDEENVCYAY